MRILNEDNDKVVNNVLLLLTKQEALQFVSDLNDLINDDNMGFKSFTDFTKR